MEEWSIEPHIHDIGTIGGSDQLHSLAALLPGIESAVVIGKDAGWASERVWMT
jgi:hypothetical protein